MNGVVLDPFPSEKAASTSAVSPAIPSIPMRDGEHRLSMYQPQDESKQWEAYSIAFDTEAPFFAAGPKDRANVRVYDSRNFNHIDTIDCQSLSSRRTGKNRDSRVSVAFGSRDDLDIPIMATGTMGEARVYNTSTRNWTLMGTLEHPPDHRVSAVAFGKIPGTDHTELVTASNREVRVYSLNDWSFKTVSVAQSLEHHWPVSAIAFSPLCTLLAVTYGDRLRLYNTSTWRKELTLCLHADHICSVTFHPTKPFLVAGLIDGRAEVYDTDNWICIKTLKHPDSVVSAAFHPTRPWLATACTDESSPEENFRVFDTCTWELLGTANHPADCGTCVAFHPSEPVLVTAGKRYERLIGWGGIRVHEMDYWIDRWK